LKAVAITFSLIVLSGKRTVCWYYFPRSVATVRLPLRLVATRRTSLRHPAPHYSLY